MVLVVIDEVHHQNVLVLPMYASMACAAAQYIFFEGSIEFIPRRSTDDRRLRSSDVGVGVVYGDW